MPQIDRANGDLQALDGFRLVFCEHAIGSLDIFGCFGLVATWEWYLHASCACALANLGLFPPSRRALPPLGRKDSKGRSLGLCFSEAGRHTWISLTYSMARYGKDLAKTRFLARIIICNTSYCTHDVATDCNSSRTASCCYLTALVQK